MALFVWAGLGLMWWGDVAAGTTHMGPSHSFMLHQIVLSSNRSVLDALEPPTRTTLLAAVAGYLPYYAADNQVTLSQGGEELRCQGKFTAMPNVCIKTSDAGM